MSEQDLMAKAVEIIKNIIQLSENSAQNIADISDKSDIVINNNLKNEFRNKMNSFQELQYPQNTLQNS